MILYYGSNMIVECPVLSAGRRALDFGAGFYLTSSFEQASRWAKAVKRRRQNGEAIVSCFELNTTAISDFSVLKFYEPDADWLDFVVGHRKEDITTSSFDIVIGPVANDSTLPVIDDYIDGRYTKEEAIVRLLPQKLIDQYAFVSERSLTALTFKQSEVVE